MAIRMSGLISNMDTDAIIKDLMSAQSMKKTKIEQSKTKLDWKQEKWKELNTKIYALYTEKLGTLRLEGGYQTRKASSSSEEKATATVSNSAANGTYELTVQNLAAAQFVTGRNMKEEGFTLSTKLMDTGMLAGTEITVCNGEDFSDVLTIEVDDETTIASFIKDLKSTGLNASFDVNQGRFFISAADSGKDNAFTITTGTPSSEETFAENEIADALDYENLSTEDKKLVQSAYYHIKNGSDEEASQWASALEALATETGRETYIPILNSAVQALVNAPEGTVPPAGSGLDALGLGEVTESVAGDGITGGDGMTVTSAKDSAFTLNGAAMTSKTNSFTANGLTITMAGITDPGQTVNITVNNDTEATTKTIKDFVKQYNELLLEMNTLFNAKRAKGYEPLTEEEKEAMSDKQVELWEGKIKDQILRRDSTMDSVMSAMRTALQTSVEVNGERYSLSTFGIVTGEYTEGGILHIQGDPEDGQFSDKEDKLTQALSDDPDKVAKVMSGVMSNLYDTLTEKMKTSTLSSAMTLYNNKEMDRQVEAYEKQIKEWDVRLKDMEDRYYKQFTSMEVSLQKLQSQQNSLAGLGG